MCIIIHFFHPFFRFDVSGLLGISAKFFSEGVHNAIRSMNDSKAVVAAMVSKSQSDSALVMAASGGAAAGACLMAGSNSCNSGLVANATKHTKDIKYNAFGPDVFVETGKVVGQNSTRLAGNVIIGVSAAFLVWDVIDLGWTVTDLVKKKGSRAAAILREKADQLEEALNETKSKYNVEMMPD